MWIGSEARSACDTWISLLPLLTLLLLTLLLLTLLLLTLLLLRLLGLLLLLLRLNHSPPWRRKRLRRRSHQYLRELFQDFHSHEKTDLPIVVLQLSERDVFGNFLKKPFELLYKGIAGHDWPFPVRSFGNAIVSMRACRAGRLCRNCCVGNNPQLVNF